MLIVDCVTFVSHIGLLGKLHAIYNKDLITCDAVDLPVRPLEGPAMDIRLVALRSTELSTPVVPYGSTVRG